MNQLSTIAAAVKTALDGVAGGGLGQAFTVERCYVPPDYDTAATNALKLLVIAFEEDLDIRGPNSTRKQCDHVYGVKLAIVKRVTAGDVTAPEALAELDGLSDFRESVIDFLKSNRQMANGQLDSMKNAPAAYDPPTLNEKSTFVSVIALNYRLLR
jgi:hypothetical protein